MRSRPVNLCGLQRHRYAPHGKPWCPAACLTSIGPPCVTTSICRLTSIQLVRTPHSLHYNRLAHSHTNQATVLKLNSIETSLKFAHMATRWPLLKVVCRRIPRNKSMSTSWAFHVPCVQHAKDESLHICLRNGIAKPFRRGSSPHVTNTASNYMIMCFALWVMSSCMGASHISTQRKQKPETTKKLSPKHETSKQLSVFVGS